MRGEDDLLFILLLWATWLLIPIVTDGVSTLWSILMTARLAARRDPQPPPDAALPRVSVVIPAYNEQHNINYCIMSLKAQTYPHHLLEIIVVDDGSEDRTSDAVIGHMGSKKARPGYLQTSSFSIGLQDFNGVLNLVRRKRDQAARHGKPAAVNAGLALASGEIVVAIDSDVVLEPTAIEEAVRAFMANENLVAATGHLIIDPYLNFAIDRTGHVQLDEHGLPLTKRLSPSENLLTACQFLEYATAFHLGRRSETQTNSLFTLSGACAVYRREPLLRAGGYRGRTVSEDTDMTMMLHRLGRGHIGYLAEMKAHLAPVITWSGLYAQRVRWQRGELEVSAVHMIPRQGERRRPLFWRVILPLRLQVDHTLTLPRLIWTFLIFALPLFGYSWSVVGEALALLYVFYTAVNILRVLVAYVFSSPPEKVLIRRYLGYTVLFPIYNMFLFWTRVSANLRTLTEDASWTVHNPFLRKLETIDPARVAARLLLYLHSLR